MDLPLEEYRRFREPRTARWLAAMYDHAMDIPEDISSTKTRKTADTVSRKRRGKKTQNESNSRQESELDAARVARLATKTEIETKLAAAAAHEAETTTLSAELVLKQKLEPDLTARGKELPGDVRKLQQALETKEDEIVVLRKENKNLQHNCEALYRDLKEEKAQNLCQICKECPKSIICLPCLLGETHTAKQKLSWLPDYPW